MYGKNVLWFLSNGQAVDIKGRNSSLLETMEWDIHENLYVVGTDNYNGCFDLTIHVVVTSHM